MVYELNCTHPLASKAGNLSRGEIFDLLLQEEQQEFLLKIPALIFMTLYICLGIPGNLLVIIVYYFRFRSSTTKTFIVSLSMFDLISCVLGIPFEIVDLRYDLELDVPVVCKSFRFLITFCACGSTLILLSVAADRFRRICQPFKRQMSVKQSKIVLACMTLISFTISAPALILYGRKTKIYRGVAMMDCTIDDQWSKTSFANGYQFILGMLWVSSILVLCVMYGVIIYKIRQQEIRRLNLTSNSMGSLHISRMYAASSSNLQPNHGLRKGSATGASSPTHGFQNSPSNKSRLQSKISHERANNNNSSLDESRPSEDGMKGLSNNININSRQTNALNRLFSRDVNPIYEEDDEAHRASNSRICDDEDENEQNESALWENIIQEEITEDGDTIVLVTTKLQDENVENESELQNPNPECPVLRQISKNNCDLSKRLSRSVPCLQLLTDTLSSVGEDFVNVVNDDNDDDTARIVASTNNGNKIKAKLKTKRSNSLPMDSEGKHVCFINQNCDINNPELPTSTPNSYNDSLYLQRKDASDDNSTESKPPGNEKDELRISKEDGQQSEKISETSNRLEVDTAGKNRYASDDRSLDRITSKSDQTNGSILTLNDSRVPQERRRKISAYSMTRQASFTSNTNSYSNDRSSKTASYCSQTSMPARVHKTSVTSYTGKMSIASTTTRELKTSRIAVMMFYVTMGHVLSYLPHLAIQFHRALGPQSMTRLLCDATYFAFHHLLLRSIFLNNAINPIIYSYNNGQFRKFCTQVLKKPLSFCKRRKNTNPYTIDSAHSLTAD